MEDHLSPGEAIALLNNLNPIWAYAIGNPQTDRFMAGAWTLNALQSKTHKEVGVDVLP